MHASTPTAPATNELQDLFGDRFIAGGSELDRVSRDESRYEPQGPALAAVFPESTQEVSAALRWANRYGVKVSVRGTGTGLSGGALAYAGGLVVSLERMNKIVRIDPVNRLAEVQAGVINAELNRAAAELGLVLRADAGPSSLAGRIDAALDRETPYVLHGCTRLVGDGSVPGLLNALVSTRLAFDGAGPDAVTVALAQEDAAALAATPALAGARRWLRSGVVPDTGPLLAELAGLRA